VLQGAVGECGKALKGRLAVAVQANVFPVLCGTAVAIVGDCGSGEVESAAVGGGDDFYGIWVMDVGRDAGDLERGHFDVRFGEGAEQGGEVFGFEEGLIALDVDVDFGVDELGDGVDAVGATGEVRRGELTGPVILTTDRGNFLGIGSYDEVVELGAGPSCLVNPCKHGAPGDGP